MVRALSISLSIVCIVGILEYIIIPHAAVSSFGNQNFLSSYLCICLPLMMVLYIDTKKLLYLIASGLAFGCLFASCTTGGYITFIVFFVIILIHTIFAKPKHFLQLLFLILIFALMFCIINFANARALKELTGAKDDFTAGIKGDSMGFNLRIKIWGNAIDMTLKHPILGIGVDCFGNETSLNYFGDKEYQEIFKGALTDKAHSEYLQISACSGIPALVAYIAFVGTIGIKLLIYFFKNKNNAYIFAVRNKCSILPIPSRWKHICNSRCTNVLYNARNCIRYP
jgi:O-antigen ligase